MKIQQKMSKEQCPIDSGLDKAGTTKMKIAPVAVDLQAKEVCKLRLKILFRDWLENECSTTTQKDLTKHVELLTTELNDFVKKIKKAHSDIKKLYRTIKKKCAEIKNIFKEDCGKAGTTMGSLAKGEINDIQNWFTEYEKTLPPTDYPSINDLSTIGARIDECKEYAEKVDPWLLFITGPGLLSHGKDILNAVNQKIKDMRMNITETEYIEREARGVTTKRDLTKLANSLIKNLVPEMGKNMELWQNLVDIIYKNIPDRREPSATKKLKRHQSILKKARTPVFTTEALRDVDKGAEWAASALTEKWPVINHIADAHAHLSTLQEAFKTIQNGPKNITNMWKGDGLEAKKDFIMNTCGAGKKIEEGIISSQKKYTEFMDFLKREKNIKIPITNKKLKTILKKEIMLLEVGEWNVEKGGMSSNNYMNDAFRKVDNQYFKNATSLGNFGGFANYRACVHDKSFQKKKKDRENYCNTAHMRVKCNGKVISSIKQDELPKLYSHGRETPTETAAWDDHIRDECDNTKNCQGYTKYKVIKPLHFDKDNNNRPYDTVYELYKKIKPDYPFKYSGEYEQKMYSDITPDCEKDRTCAPIQNLETPVFGECVLGPRYTSTPKVLPLKESYEGLKGTEVNRAYQRIIREQRRNERRKKSGKNRRRP